MTNTGFDSPTPPSTAAPPLEQAKEAVGQAGEQLAEKAQELGGQAQRRMREQVDSRSTAVGDQMSATASAARDASRQLREQGQDLPAQIIEQLADRTERLGGYLRGASPERLLHDVEDMGRRQPWAVIAGGIALGFLGARFLKASSRDRYQQRFRPAPPPPAPRTAPMSPLVDPEREAILSGAATPPLPRETGVVTPPAGAAMPGDAGAM
jgi:hypothetical protein